MWTGVVVTLCDKAEVVRAKGKKPKDNPRFVTAAAYVLMQELRCGLAGTASARAQVSTLRERFLKLGAHVIASVRRIVLHLPRSFPYRHSFHRLALNLGARSG